MATKQTGSSGSSSAGWKATLVVVLLSLTAIPVCYLFSVTKEMEEPMPLFVASVVVAFVGVPLIIYLLVRNISKAKAKLNTFFYVFTVFAFTAIVDLLIALTLFGLTNVTNFYLENGEPYLASPHGLWINFWDGTVHYLLYIYMTYAVLTNTDHRYVGLFWVGSIMNSIIVFLPGNVMGKWGQEVKPSYFLNVPYALFPILYGIKVMSSPRSQQQKQHRSRGFFPVVVDFALFVYLCAASCLTVWKAMVAVGSPILLCQWWALHVEPYLVSNTLYPLLQTMLYAFYFVPFYFASMYALYHGIRGGWHADLAALYCGASAQGQFAYMASSLHYPVALAADPHWAPVLARYMSMFLWVNLPLVIVPFLLMWRLCPSSSSPHKANQKRQPKRNSRPKQN